MNAAANDSEGTGAGKPVSGRALPAPLWQCVLVLDMVGSVRLIRQHEADVIERWVRFTDEVRREVAPARGGRVVKSLGDGLLMVFDLATAAAAAALDLQRRIADYNTERRADAHILLCIGLHCGDVRVHPDDVFGDVVNLAARLSTLASPGGVVVSADVHDQLVAGIDGDLVHMGGCYLKHVDEPVQAYTLSASGRAQAAALTHAPAFPAAGDDLRPAIAVVPFDCTIGLDPGSVFGEALADEVITLMAGSDSLQVISRLSTRGMRGRQLGAEQVAQYLGAAFVMSGHYRVSGDSVRLHVELSDTRRSRVVWAKVFDTSMAAAFDPGSPLAERIVAEASRTLMVQALDLAETQPLPTLESYNLLFAAVSLMHRASRTQFERAREMLEYLADRHGRRAVAHAWLAKWHVLRVVQGWAPDRDIEGAMALDRVRRALDASATNALALTMGGLVHAYLRKDLDTAGDLYEQALGANPNEPMAWLFSATRLAWRGEGAAAVEAAGYALRLSPLDPLRYFFDSLAATATLATDDSARAVELARRSIRANRTHASTWRTLIFALVKSGQVDEARAAARELRVIEPTLTVSRFRERFPGSGGPMELPWAQALALAGVPD